MSACEQDFVDEEEEGYFEFDQKDSGQFHFGYVHGKMDCQMATRDGSWPSSCVTSHQYQGIIGTARAAR